MTPSCIVFPVLCVAIFAASSTHGAIEDSLKHWETLSKSSIKRRIVKRDTASQHPVEQLISFGSYGRKFSLLLRKDFSIFAPDFKILVFEANGSSHELHMDLNIYRGVVQGEAKSYVNAYFTDHNVLTASIQTESELYVVEPAFNLNRNATNDSMIIYRKSDVRWSNNSWCGSINEDEDKLESVTDQRLLNETQNFRFKRDCPSSIKNTCTLYIVAHPRFVKYVGYNDLKTSANKMIAAIDLADSVFRNSVFGICGSQFGFQVKKLHLFTETTTNYPYTSSETFGYNDFLESFSSDPALAGVCLGHIFTYQPFVDGGGHVLGLGYTANSNPYKRGGICSNYPDSKNVAFTSYLGLSDLPVLRAQLVTTHELGHNWGSPHDSDSNAKCFPTSSNGGKYLMCPISVGGEDRNNNLFSPCSTAAIGDVLAVKATCFVEQKATFCGNYRIDEGEQCDPGFDVAVNGDQCCDNSCNLKTGSQCSDANHLCCKDCKIIPAVAGHKCFNTTDDLCVLDSVCDGNSGVCPQASPRPDGKNCYNGGLCRQGTCYNRCTFNGLTSCSCESEADACKRCCIDKRGDCNALLVGTSYQMLSDGSACVNGTCNIKGQCERILRGKLARLWEILDLTSPGAFVRFMRNNIVWVVIILSLIVWIPVSCCVCFLDRKAKKERKALILEVVDEELNSEPASPTPSAALPPASLPPASQPPASQPPASPEPNAQRAVQRRAQQKEKIRQVVQTTSTEPT